MRQTIEGWLRDLGHGVRTLRRMPAFTATAAATLGLAIGLLAAIYTVLNAVLLDPLPYPQPDRLVAVSGTAPGSDLPREFEVAPEFLLHYREHARQLQGLAAWSTFTSTLRVGDRVERVRMGVASPSPCSSPLGSSP